MSKHEELTGKPVSDIEEGELSDENEDKGSYYETISSVGSSSGHEKESIGKPYTKCSRVPHTLHRSRSSDDIIVLTSPVIHPKGGKHEKENFDIQKKQHDNKRRRKRRKRSSSLKTVESDDESKTGYFRGRKKKRHERRYSDDKGHFVSNTSSSSDNHKTVYPSLPKRRKSWNRSDNSYYYFKRKMSKPKKDKDLIKRVISKSGPSLSSQDSNLMKKLLASGTLGSVQSHVSPSEMHYTSVGVSSPDVDLFGDINFSGDTESVESCSEQKPTIDSLWNKDGLLIVDSDDSEIEVIIPEKKEPELIDLNSDDEVNMNTLLEDSTCNSSLVENIIVDDNKSPNEDTNAADSILGETEECNNLNEITSGEPPEAVNSCAAITSEEQIDKTNTVLLENGDDSALCTINESDVKSTDQENVVEYASISKIAETLCTINESDVKSTDQENVVEYASISKIAETLCTINESDVKSTDQENVVEYASVSKIAETLCTINESDVKSTDQENVVEYASVSKIAETEEQVHEKLVEENMHLDFQTNQEEPGVIIAVCNDEVDKVSAVIELSQTEVSQENENTVCHSSTESDIMEKSAVITEQCILEVSLENKAQEMLQHCKIENINEDERKESVSDEQENIKENCDKLDEDDDLIELRMIALNSSKEKCKELSDTEDTKNQVEKKQEEEELELRMAALKSAILKKHKERLQKGVVIKKNKTEALDDSVINSLDVMNDEVTRDSTNVSDTNDLKSCLQSKPSSPAEISLQGEEDMEIVDSDTGGEILEDNVNNECGYVMPNSDITDVFHSKCYCPSSVEPPPPGLETFPSCEPPPPGVDLYVKCPSIIDPHWNNSNRLHNGFQQFCISQPPPPPPPPPVPLLSFTQNQLPPPPPPPPADVKINSTIFSASVNNMTPTYSNITNTSNAHSSISSGSRCYHSHEPLLQPKQELNNSIYVNYSNTASVINKSSLSNNQELILARDAAYENSDIVNSENYAENFINQPNLNEKLCSEIYEGETVNKVVENIGESLIKETNGTKTKSSLRPNLVTVPLQASTSSRTTTQLKKPQVRRRRRRKTNSSSNNSVDHDKNESSDVPDQSIESAVDSNQEANTDVPNDLEGMIVLDEVGWSPDENQQDTSKTSLSDNKESFEEDVEEDENILRAKALTSLASSNVQQEKIKQVQQTVIKQIVKPKALMKETIQPKAAIRPYQNYVKNNSLHNMPPKRLPHVTRTVNFNDNSRYRLSRVVNNEARRSMIKGNSLQVMIPTDSLSPMSPHMSQVSPPQVSRLVINVGADSDSDEEDDDDNSDWTRTVTIRDEDKSKMDIVAPNINQKDFEKTVEMFLMSVRKQHETCHNDDTREDPETKPFSINENSENKENQHEMELQIQRGSKEDDSSKSVQHPVEIKQLEQQPKNQHSKAVNSGGMLRDVLSSEMRKSIENAQHSSDYNHCVLKDNEQTKNERAHEEELYENSKSGAESSTSECGSHKTDESMVTEEKRKLLKLDLLAQERKHELQRSERELVEKRYSAIDRLTEMQELLGDYEAVKGKLETYEEQVVRLQNELTAAEEKLNKHKQIVSDMKHDFFAHYTKMLIVSNYCDRLEEKCDRLGSDILGTEYTLPKTGKTMLTKKLQQVSEKQIRLDLTEDSKTVTTNRVRTDVTPRLNTTSSTNILHTDVISGDSTIKSDEARQTIGTLNHNQMNQLEMRVDTKIVNPVATKTLSPLAKVPLKQALTHQDVKQTLTQMPQRFSRNLKYSRQLTVRFPQRGRSTRLVNYKPYPEISKKLSVPQSVDTRFISSQSVPVSAIPSSPLRFQSSPLRVSVTTYAHENEQETVDQPKAAITNLPINSKISASNSVDSNTVDSSDENTNRMVKYECVSQEITRPAKTLTNLRSTSRLKDYRSPLLHLHNSVWSRSNFHWSQYWCF